MSETTARTRRRVPVAMITAGVILAAHAFSYIFTGIASLFDLGILGSRPAADFMALGALTKAGQQLSVTIFILLFGALALWMLIGFVFRWRWAWTAAMTWAAMSLALGVFNFFRGEPQFLNMFVGVVFALVLNLSTVQAAFREQGA